MCSKNIKGFKGLVGFYKNIKKGRITLGKAEKKQKEFKSEKNEIVQGKNKSEEQNILINNIKTIYESKKKVIKLFDS